MKENKKGMFGNKYAEYTTFKKFGVFKKTKKCRKVIKILLKYQIG